ncbi:MAG: molybdopterin molybdotransferase MoeA [Psychromonas sp.]|nr:molybdopterin molybdotransferase MoeA [Psychromonas sp.]
MACCDVKGLMPLDEALKHMQSAVGNVCGSLMISLSDALGYGLAVDILSPMNVPSFNNSAMDGYALKQADLLNCDSNNPVTLQMIGKSFAGLSYTGDLPTGCCIRIMTGAILPNGADTVVMQERAQINGQAISFTEQPQKSDNVRFAGENIKTGQLVLKKGHKLTARDLPLIASLGIIEILVYRQLKVAVISSGNELKSLGETLSEGEIYDSNRYCIMALLSRLNVEVIDFGIIKDERRLILDAINSADQQADVVITSGGVSVGEADFIKEVLTNLGEIIFWKLAIKPGKPFAFGKLPNSVFFGLPGNPVSALVTLYQLAVPAMIKMSGVNKPDTLRLNAKSADLLKKNPGRTDFQRGNYYVDLQGQLIVESIGAQGSGIFSSMSRSNCFIVLEQNRGNIEKGEMVVIEPYSYLIN